MSFHRDLLKIKDEFDREAKRAEIQGRKFGEHSSLRARFKARELAFRHASDRVTDLAASLESATPGRAFDPEIAEPGRW